ncbi:TIGR04540 family protein [Clostridium sp.]|uniref:TIGR04540 family protein n=1 Tax=Clostridium sp. TaxID=1506 RepID=UPI003F3C54E9
MRAVYRNPKELASKMRDLVDQYQDELISYEKLEKTVIAMIEANEDRVYKNGFMPSKLINVLGEERKAIIDEISEKIK